MAKSKKQRRTQQINLRLTESEFDSLSDAAEFYGMPVSGYLRWLHRMDVLNRARRRVRRHQ